MTYPMKVLKISLDHQGGTKSYHMVLISTADDKGLLLKRWGKTKVFGETKTELYDTTLEAEKVYERTLNEKQRKGYRIVNRSLDTVNDLDELAKQVGRPCFMRFDAAAIKHLDASADTTGVREPDAPRFNEDGEFLGNPEPRKISKEELDRARREEAAEKYKNNPLFGRF